MPIRFNPSGLLDVASDPADLPSQSDGKMEVSGAMTRCTNLHLDRGGMAITRRGSAKLNATAVAPQIHRIIEQDGNRYTFADTQIYKNETSIQTEMADSPWSALLYNAYNTEVQSIFALNGTDRKRIEDETIYEWGSESPTVAPVLGYGSITGLTGAYNAKYTWVRKEGDVVVWESNPSPAADNSLSLTNQSLIVTCALSTDTQITHLRVYRTLTDGGTYYYDIELTVPTADDTEYDYAYLYNWEIDYLTLNVPPADVYLYDWETFYIEDGYDDYQAFTYDATTGISHMYSWEIDDDYDGSDSGYKYTSPWEDPANEVAAAVYQPFTYSTYTGISNTYTWEIDPDYEGDDNDLKATFPWEFAVSDISMVSYVSDSALGTEASWTGHDRPPLGTTVLGPAYGGHIFILKDNLLYYCMPNQPEYWPTTYYIEVTSIQNPVKAGAFLNGQLFLASASEIYSIQGTGPGTFFPLPMSAQTGTVNPDCFVAVVGYGIFHLGNDGIYQYASGKDDLITRGQFEPIFWGETAGSIPGLNRNYIDNCWMLNSHGKLYFAYPGGSSQYADNFLILDLANKRIVHHAYTATMKTAAYDYKNKRILTGDINGYIWEIEKIELTDDDGTEIAWQIQSKNFNQYYKYFPRYAKYDVNVNGGSATGYILLNDTVKQAHTLTGDRISRKRLVAGCTGERLAVRLSGTGGVHIYGVEVE